MRQLSLAAFVVTVGFVCSFLLPADAKNEKAQQVGEDPRTFVVRYKNGDQTIPVTVVLDYKKQTEYVINMNPRTPTKSVTLYDFKQRTIAYKDLTNRECFLGRLTYETLKEEADALNKIQSPVDHKPKMLTLDPQKPALTPTEIRNIAGQRTAVFCRKMNTWLVKPQNSHRISKRETHDEEVEERTYHRHGFHTVRYSHYGRETRRRIRNSRRNGTKQSLYDHKNTSNETSRSPGTSDKDSFFGEKFPSFQTSHHSHHPPSIGGEPPLPPSNHPFSHGIPESRIPNPKDIPNEHEFQNPFENAEESHHRITERTPNEHRYPSHNGFFDSGNFNAFPGRAGANNTNESGNPSGALYSRSPVFTEDTLEPKNHPEPSFPGSHGFENYSPERNGYGQRHDLSRIPNHRQIESEWSPNETSPLYVPRTYPQIPNSLDVPENPDVSTNVLEIPKNTNKFENFDHNPASHLVIPPTNEDVHDLFEGFYNFQGKAPENIHLPKDNFQGHSYEPHLSQHGTNYDPNFIHSDVNPVGNIPSLSLSREIGKASSNEYLRGQAVPHLPIDTTTTTTESYSFTLPYEPRHVLPPTTVPHLNGIPSHRRYDDSNAGRIPPFNEQINSVERPHQPTFSLNSYTAPPVYTTPPPIHFATPPPNRYGVSNQRSDIPSEADHGDSLGSNAYRNAESPLSRQNHSRPFLTSQGGVVHQQGPVQDPLSGYKPDEIVINLGDLSTERSPVAGFQDRGIVRTDPPPTRRPVTTTVSTTTERRSQQVSGGVWRSSHQSNSRHPSRRPTVHRQQHSPRARTYPQRQPFAIRQPQPFQRRVHTNGHEYPRTFDHQAPYPLDALPPGVSIHPRHPQAPYADMFQSNIPPPLPPESGYKTAKAHRQRHFRKKNRLTNCCRLNGKSNGNCCRNGGSCCNGKGTVPRTPCCSNGNRGHVLPPRRNHVPLNFPPAEIAAPDGRHTYRNNENRPPSLVEHRPLNDGRYSAPRILLPNDSPQPPRRTLEDNKERCLKEKMCRTVYESTQQVIVCRNADVAGC